MKQTHLYSKVDVGYLGLRSLLHRGHFLHAENPRPTTAYPTLASVNEEAIVNAFHGRPQTLFPDIRSRFFGADILRIPL